MLEEIRKGLLTGFGAVFLTREKVEDVTKRLVKDAKLSREDAQKLAEELLTTGERQWEDLEKVVMDAVRKGVDKLGISTRSDLDDLKAEIEKLEKRLAVVEASRAGQEEQ